MRIKYALVALIGLFLGSIAGGIGVALIFADMPQATSVWRPQSSPPMKLPRRPRPRPIGTSGAMKSIVSK